MSDELIETFKKIGLDEKKAKETSRNAKLGALLKRVIEEAGVQSAGCNKSVGVLLYILATTVPAALSKSTSKIVGYIVREEIKNEIQLKAVFEYMESKGEKIENEEEFKKYCGIGVVVTEKEIEEEVGSIMEAHRKAIEEEKYKMYGVLMKLMRGSEKLKWADGKVVKAIVDKKLEKMVGTKEEVKKAEEKKAEEKKAEEKKENGKLNEIHMDEMENEDWEFKGEMGLLHKPGENKQLRPEIMQKHLKETGGKIITRFPPEPNGFLHLGHAKAINIDFRYAFQHGGECNLRYDDTNPEAEDPVYFTEILKNVEWLGFKPTRITHSSDYFDQLYEYAKELIRRDKAYVCHQTAEEIKEGRGGADFKGPRKPSPWRNRPIEESLRLFEDMKNGKCKEGEAVLRLKGDLTSGNPTMWDLVGYRVIFKPHARTGDKWCIYPTYDFAHPLCDSLENITHSLCTKEFVLNREFYYWICDALAVYKPVQWEFERLKVTGSVLSKRKVLKLVESKTVFGWNDPRLFTLNGLQRRGFTPRAINRFVRDLGVSTAESKVPVERLEHYVRKDLNLTSPRIMAVLDPLKVTIIDYPNDRTEEFSVPNFPFDESKGSHKVPFSRVIYIERSDFREDEVQGYKRLAPGKTVGLLYCPYTITCSDIKYDSNNKLCEILAICDYGIPKQKKPHTYIHWVASCPRLNSPLLCEIRLLNPLYLDEDQTVINPKSIEYIPNAFVSLGARNAVPGDRFQFFRTGFFAVDTTSTKDHLVFNRTITLNEDPNKV